MNNKGGKIVEPALTADMIQSWRDKIGQAHSASPLLPSQERGLFSRFSSLHRMLNSQPRRIRRRLSRKTRLSLTDIAFMLAMGIALPAEAQTILVNTTDVNTSRDGLCSLMEAINNSNGDRTTHADCPAGSGADTIILGDGSTYLITRSVNLTPGQGLPAITSEITIEGNDSTIHVAAVPVDVVFNVAPKGILTLKDTTISGDLASGTGTDAPRIRITGNLHLSNVTVLLDSNRVSAITNAGLGTMHADGLDVNCGGTCDYWNYDQTGHGIVNEGSMTLSNVQVRNLAFTLQSNYIYDFYDFNFTGGAINNSGILNLDNVLVENNGNWSGSAGVVNTGTITGTNVTINNNHAFGGLCGILSEDNSSLSLKDSIINSPNTYYGCINFTNRGNANLERVVIASGNSVVNRGKLELLESSISNLIYGFHSNGDLAIDRSTIFNNGGGISISNNATVLNSTISGNDNLDWDNHPSAAAFGLSFSGDIAINNSTLGGNHMIDVGYIYPDVPEAGGILFDGDVSLSNSILVGSSIYDNDTSPTFYSVLINRGVLNSSHNIFGDSSFSNAEAFSGFTPGPTDIVATSDGTHPTPLGNILDVETDYGYESPRLADNGGTTPTVALVDGSPAIDAGGANCEPTDQRGIARPQGTACDMGAFELADSPPVGPAISENGVATVNHNWTSITVDDMPFETVIIAGPPTFNGGDPGVGRIGQVVPGGFDIRFQEWDYRDGRHTREQIPYLVAQAGRHMMPDGSIWEAGLLSHSGTPNWDSQSFTESFPGIPHLFLTIQTENDKHAVTARAQNVTATGFDIGFFEQESLMDGHLDEIVGYLAIYNPSGTGSIDIDGASVSYDLRQTSINHNWAWVLGKEMKVEEERSKDTEIWHRFEYVDVMDLGGSLFGQIVTSNGADPAALRQR